MSVRAVPTVVAIDASSLIIAQGPADVAVYWSVTGNGTLYPIHLVTGNNGVAAAVLYPTGAAGDEISVKVEYGA